MRIAIPTTNGRLSSHFGHCERFTIVDVDPEARTILAAREVEPPPHEPGVLPRWLAAEEAELILAGGMGGRARALFSQSGIRVVVGAPVDTPTNLVMAYLGGTLDSGENPCDH